MAAPQMEMKEQNVQGEYSTAEITHISESLRLEGMCYLKNHKAMLLTGVEGAIREWHDNVTRPNLERLTGVAKEMGIPLPFTKPLEERENEIKAKLKNANVEGTVTEGEALEDILMSAKHANVWYATSFNLASHAPVEDVFRRNLQTTIDNKPRLVEAFRRTKEFVAPPIAQNIKLVGAQAKGITGGGRQ